MWSTDRDGVVESDDKLTKVMNFCNKGRISVLQQVRITLDYKLMAYLDIGYHSSKAWSSNWDHPHDAQYFSP